MWLLFFFWTCTFNTYCIAHASQNCKHISSKLDWLMCINFVSKIPILAVQLYSPLLYWELFSVAIYYNLSWLQEICFHRKILGDMLQRINCSISSETLASQDLGIPYSHFLLIMNSQVSFALYQLKSLCNYNMKHLWASSVDTFITKPHLLSHMFDTCVVCNMYSFEFVSCQHVMLKSALLCSFWILRMLACDYSYVIRTPFNDHQ